MFLGKIRNRRTSAEKDETDKNASIAAQEERNYNKPYPKPTRQYTKKYTQREWNRFKPAQQEILTSRYTVVLTDHQTRNEKIKKTAKKVNLKNFDKGMKKFGSAQDTFWKEWDKGFSDAGMKSKRKTTIYGEKSSDNNSSKIYGNPSKKVKAKTWKW